MIPAELPSRRILAKRKIALLLMSETLLQGNFNFLLIYGTQLVMSPTSNGLIS